MPKKKLWCKVENDNDKRKIKARWQESSKKAEVIPTALGATRCFFMECTLVESGLEEHVKFL